MKIQFEGTAAEFALLFGQRTESSMLPAGAPLDFQPSGQASHGLFEVVEGGVTVTDPQAEPVSVNPLSNDMPVPNNDPNVGKQIKLPTLSEEEREVAWKKFVEVCMLWTENFGKEEEVEVEEFSALRNKAGDLVDEAGKLIPFGKAAVQVSRKVKRLVPCKQPDRQKALTELGEGRYPRAVLVMGYEIKSLQRLVQKALKEGGHESAEDLDFVDQIASTMVAVSHKAFPDLSGVYDYSTRWKREF